MATPQDNTSEDHPFKTEFSPDERSRLLNDDHQAWHNVCGLLIGIISMGLMIAVTAVILSAT